MINLVEFTIASKSIAKVSAHSLIDLLHLLCFITLHGFLNQLQALSMVLVLDGAHVRMRVFVVGRNFHTTLGCQLGGSTLSKVPAELTNITSSGFQVGQDDKIIEIICGLQSTREQINTQNQEQECRYIAYNMHITRTSK